VETNKTPRSEFVEAYLESLAGLERLINLLDAFSKALFQHQETMKKVYGTALVAFGDKDEHGTRPC
jgi:class 3 adenylate cyclase